MADVEQVDEAPSAKPRLGRSRPYIIVALLSLLIAVFVHQLWSQDLSVPFSYQGDSVPVAVQFRQMKDNHQIYVDHRFAAPYDQQFADRPFPELLTLFFGWFVFLFTSSWAVALNLTFLLSYALVAIAALWVFRKFGISNRVAIALSLIYTYLPYHWGQGVSHIYLAAYYAGPLTILLAWQLLKGENIFQRKAGTNGVRSWFSATNMQTTGILVVIALSNGYYGVFAALTLMLAVVVRCIVDKNIRWLWSGLLGSLILAATVLVAITPSLAYHSKHGQNDLLNARLEQDSTTWSLTLGQLVLAQPDHRLTKLANDRVRFSNSTIDFGEDESLALGAVAAIGFIGLIGFVVCSPLLPDKRKKTVYLPLAVLAIGLFLIAQKGGGGLLFAHYFTPQYRVWGRFVVLIGFVSLAAVGYWLDNAFLKERFSRNPNLPVVILVLLVAVAIFDQTSSNEVTSKADEVAYKSDKSFFEKVEKALPSGAAVFQLPIAEYPATYPGIADYEMLRPYLQTDDLKWSSGGMRARYQSGWQNQLSADPRTLVKQVAALGYSGIQLDRNADIGGLPIFEAVFANASRTAVLTSPDRRQMFFDLRKYARTIPTREKASISNQLLSNVSVTYGRRTTNIRMDSHDKWFDAAGDATLSFDNQSGANRRVKVSFELSSPTVRMVRIVWPDGSSQQEVVDGTRRLVTKSLTLGQNITSAQFSTSGDKYCATKSMLACDAEFRVFNPTIKRL